MAGRIPASRLKLIVALDALGKANVALTVARDALKDRDRATPAMFALIDEALAAIAKARPKANSDQ